MARTYKISVAYYLNKRFKPIIDTKGVEKYPLYYYITIRRRTINKPFDIGDEKEEPLYLSEKEFDQFNKSVSAQNASTTIIKICEIFIKDHENNNINNTLKLIAKRGFNSKDEFTNALNSYIAFYSQQISDLLAEYAKQITCNELAETLKRNLEFSAVTDNTIKTIATNILETINGEPAPNNIKAISQNIDGTALAIYYFSEVLQNYDGITPLFYLYEWQTPEVKTAIVNKILTDKTIEKQTHAKQRLNLTRPNIEKILLPVLDEILSPQYQLNERLKH